MMPFLDKKDEHVETLI